jgi:three-Cys-motif partner protein
LTLNDPLKERSKPEAAGTKQVPARPGYLQAAAPPELPRPSKPRGSKKPRATKSFFDEAMPHSIVKTEIVSKYFPPWARIMKPRAHGGKMAYMDLYAGKGIYADGTDSTPIRIMKAVLADEGLRQMVVTFFADADPECVAALQANISALPDIERLKYRPQIALGAAHEHGIAEAFETRDVVPTFMFLDPFGYHGLSTKLMRSILKNFGCEIAFFFKYTRIRAALRNKLVREEMDAIFGHERVEKLKNLLPSIGTQDEKERTILTGLEEALGEIGGKYVLTFRFRNEFGRATHHLVFVTKNELAHDIMKEIMAAASTGKRQGVATFEFTPNTPHDAAVMLPLFDHAEHPLDRLKEELLERYRGRRIKIEEIYSDHNYKTPYTKKNYSEALRQLHYEDNKVSAERGQLSPPLNGKSRWPMPFENTYITFDKA